MFSGSKNGGELEHHRMTWPDFYLVCFAVGFCLSFFSFLSSAERAWAIAFASLSWPRRACAICFGDTQVPRFQHRVGARRRERARQDKRVQARAASRPSTSSRSTAFLAWFGGTGYLLTRYSGLRVGVWIAACHQQSGWSAAALCSCS